MTPGGKYYFKMVKLIIWRANNFETKCKLTVNQPLQFSSDFVQLYKCEYGQRLHSNKHCQSLWELNTYASDSRSIKTFLEFIIAHFHQSQFINKKEINDIWVSLNYSHTSPMYFAKYIQMRFFSFTLKFYTKFIIVQGLQKNIHRKLSPILTSNIIKINNDIKPTSRVSISNFLRIII